MRDFERERLLRKMEVAMLPLRLARKRRIGGEGWLKNMRLALGIPVEEVARRLGVCRWEVHRLEKSEKDSRIMLSTLSRAANGLGCELVYGLAPLEGTLEELAAEQRDARKRLRLEREQKRIEKRKPWLEYLGWREALLGALRTALRREGFRVRPRKTDRGVAQQMEEFKETLKLVKYADVVGRAMEDRD